MEAVDVKQPQQEHSTPLDAFNAFVNAEEVSDILSTFGELKSLCAADGKSTYDSIKEAVGANFRNEIFKILDAKMHTPKEETSNLKILVVGGGPAGFRFAIESVFLMGTSAARNITILEKRTNFTRNNVMHLWPSSIEDLISIGAKYFFRKFCTGSISHISIKRLQKILLKVCLILGVEYHQGTSFVELKKPQRGKHEDMWVAVARDSEENSLEFPCNVLMGADGHKSVVSQVLGFERKDFKAGTAIGITANFLNHHSKDESHLDEFAYTSYFKQDFFGELKDGKNIELENVVYYRDETHYFVMTVKKQCLIDRGVITEFEIGEGDLFLQQNVNRDALKELAKEVADYCQVPCNTFVMDDRNGQEDVEIFDFTKKTVSTQSVKVLEDCGTGQRVLTGLLGDALMEPFWPLGTGCNRAILSALDTASILPEFSAHLKKVPNQGDDSKELEHVLAGRETVFTLMQHSAPSTLKSDFKHQTTEPSSRYLHLPPPHEPGSSIKLLEIM